MALYIFLLAVGQIACALILGWTIRELKNCLTHVAEKQETLKKQIGFLGSVLAVDSDDVARITQEFETYKRYAEQAFIKKNPAIELNMTKSGKGN